jgi:ABC-type nitrate/sulfonate/bicarbonate transport system substrate-binding protein
MLEMHGASQLLTSFNDSIQGFVFSGIVTTDDFRSKNPEQVKAFVKGMLKAFQFIKEHESEAKALLPKYCGVEMDIAVKSALREYSGDGREPEESIYLQQDLMIQYGFLKEKVPTEKLVDYSFLPN